MNLVDPNDVVRFEPSGLSQAETLELLGIDPSEHEDIATIDTRRGTVTITGVSREAGTVTVSRSDRRTQRDELQATWNVYERPRGAGGFRKNQLAQADATSRERGTVPVYSRIGLVTATLPTLSRWV